MTIVTPAMPIEAPPRPRDIGPRALRAAHIGQAAMGLIMLGLGVLTAWTLIQSHSDMRAARGSIAVADAYDRMLHAGAAAALHAANASKSGDLSEVEAMNQAIASAFTHVTTVTQIGSDADRQFLDGLVERYAADVARAADLVSSGKVPASDAGLNTIATIEESIRPVAAERRQSASRDFAAFESHLVTRSFALLAVFATGLPLVICLFLITRYLERRDMERRAELERMHQAAYTDSLTGLPNHRAFHEALVEAVARSAADQTPLSVALIDIDDFKEINDGGGHAAGDSVLVKFARLAATVARSAKCYRVGGDEFALILPAANRAFAQATLGSLMTAARERIAPTISIGFATCTTPDCGAEALRDQADAALYEAKQRGKDQVQFYDENLEARLSATSEKMIALRRLLHEGEVTMVFQPIIELPGGRTYAYEALLRLKGEFGIAGPEEAFEIAVRMGLSRDLDSLCIARALEESRGLPAETRLFLNLHPSTLFHAGFSADDLLALVTRAGIAPERVVFEVTEQTAAPLKAITPHIRRLREHGFGVALDDVGSGNAGLQILRATTFDYIKLDRSVVHDACHDTGRGVLEAVAAFARTTGAFLIAEGIESAEIAESLRSAGPGSDYLVSGVQGFLFGRPLECREIRSRIRAHADRMAPAA
jgi:diguanylate cyclase (GGDEF)-like protein